MFGAFDWIKLPAAALAGITLGLTLGYQWGKQAERDSAALEAAQGALNRIEDMEKNNADFLALPDRERCLVFMRDSGLPEDSCDER